MKKYIDEHGMIVQGLPHRDGGDSCQRMGMYHFGAKIREKIGIENDKKVWPRVDDLFYSLAIIKLQNANGDLRRHPDEYMWYGDWKRASRDQTIPFICACGALGETAALWKYIKSHAKRCFLFTTNTIPNWVYPPGDVRHIEFDWNPWKRFKFFFGWRPKNDKGKQEPVYGVKLPDLTLFEFWAAEIRAAKLWILWPFLLILDLQTLASALVWKFGRKDDFDVLNTIIIQVNGAFYLQTWTMDLANIIIDWDMMYGKLFRYFTEYPAKIGPMAIFYSPILKFMKIKYN